MKKLLCVAALSLITAPAQAKQEYSTYEGADAVQQGSGGARISKNGIDYWTAGSPPRRYKVLGILTDARRDRPLDGNAIGSKSIAKQVLQAGGNAVIVVGANTRNAGFTGGVNAYAGNGWGSATGYGKAVHRTTTTLLVIQYLPE